MSLSESKSEAMKRELVKEAAGVTTVREGTAFHSPAPGPTTVQNRSEAGSRVQNGMLILNADDWGRDCESTDRTSACLRLGALSSVSAMVFMQDSDRGAALARAQQVDAGLHLNLTAAFTGEKVPARLAEHQQKVARYLCRNKVAPAIFHPGLTGSFEYSVMTQVEEFARLYGTAAARIDGHHHMHLCANVMRQELLPAGTIVRRNFSFRAGEKSWANRQYRAWQDRRLAQRHRMTDFFFSLPPLEQDRVQRIFAAAKTATVEVETHPVAEGEYRFLSEGTIFEWAKGIPIEPAYRLPACANRERQP